MTSNDATFHVRKMLGGVSIIDISGEMTGAVEESLMTAYKEASNGSTKTIMLNFERLVYMNSTGIGLLITMLIRVQRHNQKLLAFGLSEHYQEIFELTRLNEAIGIYDSEAAALAAVA